MRGTSFQRKRLTTCVGNWLRTVTSDQTPYTIIRRFLSLSNTSVRYISLDRNYLKVINLLFVLPGLYLKYTQNWENIAILEQKILNMRGKCLELASRWFLAYFFSSKIAENSSACKICFFFFRVTRTTSGLEDWNFLFGILFYWTLNVGRRNVGISSVFVA